MPLPENFCFAPFHRLQVSNKKCGPCTYRANVWDRGNKTVKEFWQGSEMSELRDSFLANKKHSLCYLCWREEDAGQSSLRMRLNDFSGSKNIKRAMENYVLKGQYKKFPKVVSMVPGNQCNMACPTCDPELSSKWNGIVNKHPGDYPQSVSLNWNMTDDEYKDIVDNSDHIQKIELFGGEPFYNKKNKSQLIQKLIEKQTSRHITLYFNTNCTVYDADFIENISQNFKKIEIRASIDGINSQYEFLRFPGIYKETIANCDKFDQLPNSDFEIISTISLWNFLYLDDYYEEFCVKNNWSVRWNLVANMDYLLLYNLPEQIKEQILMPDRFKFVEKYIKGTPSKIEDWNRFVRYTKVLEKQRKQNIKQIFPKFYNLVKSHGFES